jgi:hypothetical protein
MTEAPSEFDRCAPWIEAALEYTGGTHGIEDVRAAVAAGSMQLWPGERSALVTEVVQYPRLKAARIFAGGGDLDELRLMGESVMAWAAWNGCQRVEGFGRWGWGRALDDLPCERRVFMWRNA